MGLSEDRWRVKGMRFLTFRRINRIALCVFASLFLIGNALYGADQKVVRPSGFGEAGTRALGMGEAYVAISDGADGVFWNPAGLAFMQDDKRYVDVMIKANERDESTYDSMALAGPVYTEAKKAEFSIQDYLESNLKAPVFSKKLNYHYGVGAIFIDTYGGAEIQNYFFGIGKIRRLI